MGGVVAGAKALMDPVAGYAAVVATAALGWQVYTSTRANRTRIQVSCDAGLVASGPGWQGKPRVWVRVVNQSGHDVPMPGVMLSQPSIGRHWPITQQDVDEEVPPTLRARDDQWFTVPASRFQGMQVEDPVIAYVITATGKSFSSEPSVLGVGVGTHSGHAHNR